MAFQLLVYPMLDDRTAARTDIDGTNHRMWTNASNRFGWASYLGKSEPTPYSAPARASDLTGLPPAWLGVGTYDLFHDEDLAYAKRLQESGVPCAVETVPGAFHGFDAVVRKAPVVRAFGASQIAALKKALFS